jgi:hypothetical protein
MAKTSFTKNTSHLVGIHKDVDKNTLFFANDDGRCSLVDAFSGAARPTRSRQCRGIPTAGGLPPLLQ